jgi:NTE family protein
MNLSRNILLLVFLMINTVNYAQKHQNEQTKDVKVGLVLSGGGAKGFAHIGVLKVIEKAGIRIDYIAGTSMGAIVGGLYAAGYNADQLDSILKSHDFTKLFKDNVPRKYLSFYQKENLGKYAVSLPINKKKIGFPSAVTDGQNVFNLFSELTKHVHTVTNFENLPIPFFCIATNLENGDEVVLDHGFLPQAIRASGTFPGLLSPIEIEGKTLVDGGIVDNYPVEKLLKKGVDYVIGVDVQGKLHPVEEVNSMPKLMRQIVGFQMYKDINKKIELTDVYIKPDITGYDNFSFDSKSEIVERGIIAADEQFDKLLEIASKQKKKVLYPGVKFGHTDVDFVVKAIDFKGNVNYTEKYLLKKLNFDVGSTINTTRFMEGINALTATKNFKSVQYRLTPVEGGMRIEFNVLEDDVSTFIQLGVHYDDLYKTGVLVNLTSKHLFFKNDFFSTDIVVGDKFRYNIDYFLDNGFNWSFGVNSRYNSFGLEFLAVFDESSEENADEFGLKIPITYNDFSTQFFFQTTFKNRMALRLGAEHKFLKSYIETIVNDKVRKEYIDNSNYLNGFAKAIFDSYDSKIFPKRGFYFEANYKMYLLSSDYFNDFEPFSQVYGNIGYAFTPFNRFTIHLTSDAGITIGSSNNFIHDYHLGGNNENFINTFVPFYGYEVADLSDVGFVKTALELRYEIFKKNYISLLGNFSRMDDDLWNGGDIFDDTRTGYSVGYGVNTLIGPIQLNYSWSPETNNSFWYFNLGFWF